MLDGWLAPVPPGRHTYVVNTKIILVIAAVGLAILLGLVIVFDSVESGDWLAGAWDGSAQGRLTMAIPQDMSEYAPDAGKLVTESDHEYTLAIAFSRSSSGQVTATVTVHESVGDLSSIVGTYPADVTVNGETIRCAHYDTLELDDIGPVSATTLLLTLTRSGGDLVGDGSLATTLLDAAGEEVLVQGDDGRSVVAGTARTFRGIRLQKPEA
jgi:hypothetical protein